VNLGLRAAVGLFSCLSWESFAEDILSSNTPPQTDGRNFHEFVFIGLKSLFFDSGLQTVLQNPKLRPAMGHEKKKKLTKGFRWAWVLNIASSKKLGQQRTKRRAKWLFKKAWNFEHFPQAIWAINGPREES
jgi:hypothetical protein